MNILDFTNIKEHSVKIEFMEAGGSAASRYKYLTHIKIFSKSEKIFLSYKEVREFLSNKPRLIVSNQKELSLEAYKEFLGDLFKHKILQLNHSFLTENSEDKRTNYFLLELDNDIIVRFEYNYSHLDIPDFEPFKEIIQSVKNLLFSNLG